MKAEDIVYSVQLIQKRILTPIIYLSEFEDKNEFICFCADNPSENEFFTIGEELSKALDIPTEVVDIFEYAPEDRADVIMDSQLVYTEDPFIEKILAAGISEEVKREQEESKGLLIRKEETGTVYLQ